MPDTSKIAVMAATTPQRYAEPTVRMSKEEDLPAPTENALRPLRNAMQAIIAPMGVMKQHMVVETTAAIWRVEGLNAPMDKNVSLLGVNAMESVSVLMGVMRPQIHVEPTARRWREGLLAPTDHA